MKPGETGLERQEQGAMMTESSYLNSSPPAGLQGPGTGQHKGTGLRNLTLDVEILQSQVGGRGVGRHLSSGS